MKSLKIVLPLLFLAFSLVFPLSVKGQSASVYIAPYGGTFFVGNTFDVSIFVNTEGSSINAVEVNLKFSPDLLQVTSPTAGASFISVWADQPTYSNTEGTLSFKGGVPSPGIKTSAGLISTITFRAKVPGKALVSFLDSSKVLLADGQGTDILQNTANGEYDLILKPPEGPKIYSPTHPSVNTWYKNNNPVFAIEKEAGVTDFSYNLDQDPLGIPDNISEGANTSVTLNNVASGVWYFHAKAKKNGVWGGQSTYGIKIDDIPPGDFKVDINAVGQAGDSRFFAYFAAEDSLSGLDHYEVSVADITDTQEFVYPFFVEASSPYLFPVAKAGKYEIFVRAFDKAGNYTQSNATLRTLGSLFSYTDNGIKIKNFLFPFWLIYVLIFIFLVLFGFFFFRYLAKRNLAGRLKNEVAEAEKEIDDVKRLEKKIQDMRSLEEEAKKQSERLAERLKENNNFINKEGEPPKENQN